MEYSSLTATQYPVFTIGHSNLSLDAFLALLRMHDVDEIADVPVDSRQPIRLLLQLEILSEALDGRA